MTALAGLAAAPALARSPAAQGSTGTRDAFGVLMAETGTAAGNISTPRGGTGNTPLGAAAAASSATLMPVESTAYRRAA